jgi:hypothetical protein
MSDVALLAIMVVAFALAIGLVQVLGRLIESGGRDDWAAEPPDPAGNNGTALAPDVTDQGGPR